MSTTTGTRTAARLYADVFARFRDEAVPGGYFTLRVVGDVHVAGEGAGQASGDTVDVLIVGDEQSGSRLVPASRYGNYRGLDDEPTDLAKGYDWKAPRLHRVAIAGGLYLRCTPEELASWLDLAKREYAKAGWLDDPEDLAKRFAALATLADNEIRK